MIIIEATTESADNIDYYGTRKEIVPFIPVSCKRVLEIGSAEGDFRNFFSKDCEYWGIEPSIESAIKSKKILHKVIINYFDAAKQELPENYFDLVVCNDVIEHMVDPQDFLESIKGHLKADGYIIGSVPNVRYIQNLLNLILHKDWKYESCGILDRTHLKFFTQSSLRRLFSECGYEIVLMYGINPEVLNYWSIKSILRRFVIYCLGRDTKYQQFGFRILPKK
jgi:2-polyprenyl-3-methyl-5-hydroxy-6-metoxy-1,4-benzoquinol methylase